MHDPTISIIIATYRRRDVVLSTLHRLFALGAEVRGAEIIVVDNASGDGTAEAIAKRFPGVRCITLARNYGACAKAFGVDTAGGELIVFLDDDSYPRPGSLSRMAAHFAADEQLGAASFLAHLPDGRVECCAFHNVVIGCGVGFRRAALAQVGGLDRKLFMAAEEYDLSFRLINAGWRVRTFTDLHVDHLKSPTARASARLVRLDTRNNLWLTARYLTGKLARVYRQDWAQRYAWIAQRSDHRFAFWRGYAEAMLGHPAQHRRYAGQRLSPAAREAIFNFDYIAEQMRRLADDGARRVLFAGLGKNMYAFVRAAKRCDLWIAAIADDNFAAPRRTYRGIPIVRMEDGLNLRHHAVVIAHTSPEQARRCAEQLRSETPTPIHRWFDYDRPAGTPAPVEPASAAYALA